MRNYQLDLKLIKIRFFLEKINKSWIKVAHKNTNEQMEVGWRDETQHYPTLSMLLLGCAVA